MPRNKPYTYDGIRKQKCFRCGAQAFHQWQICSDNNVYRPVCLKCDIMVNRMILKFMKFKDWESKLRTYIASQYDG